MHLRIYLWLSCVVLAGYVRATENSTANRVELNDTGRFLNKYYVVTCDGYILTTFRLTFENDSALPNKYPVLIVHGMFQSSDIFIKDSRERYLAFQLQDLGYDVWLANVRGNKHARHHIYYEPETDEKTDFFNYSYDEIGRYDIAATVDLILNVTRFLKLHYIGYSLGGTVFLVLNSLEPMYNNKFRTAHLLAPIGYQKYFPYNQLMSEVNRCDEIYEALLKRGILEIFPYEPNNENVSFSPEECLGDKTYQNICRELNIQEIMTFVAEPTPDTQNDGPLASDRDLFIDDDGSGLEIDESSGSGWGPGPGPDDEDGRGSGDAPGPTLTDDEDFSPRTVPTTTTTTPEPTTVEPEYVAPRVLDEKPSPGAEEPRGAGGEQPSRPETDISISREEVSPGTDQDPSGSNVGAESRPQDNVVFIMNAKPEDRATSFFAQPGILAAVIGGAVVGLLCAILVVMFIVYRMRKKDEGSYALDEPKRSPAAASYGKGQNNREFYA